MPCFFPRPYAVRGINPLTGKKIIKVLPGTASPYDENAFACRKCTGCRLERSRQWAMRCVHEMKSHRNNCFITLTYRPADLPPGGSLVKRDVQLFVKKLRKKYGAGLRYYYCGEYGEQMRRPHYHMILFGKDFDDRHSPRKGESGEVVYQSHSLSKLWDKGFSYVGEATFESAAYVARYIMKKQFGKSSVSHYKGLTPEFTDMSRRPGIGKAWWDRYQPGKINPDQVVHKGKAWKVPEFYDRQMEKHDEVTFKEIKAERKNKKQLRQKRFTSAKEMAQAIKERRNADKHARLVQNQRAKRNYEK